ncbi:hypothetical protein [Picrophilus oshimae]|uniref:Hypothetical membrane spanning protein n=1 Tax=Picrophilus torridus (strain ATCC 700027 / DSM 9790 / JCM 10055 / NBRC 100828 / KAW 2/3) TaxID=1122961 RepID=Q6KYV7_PICTO|nr:hypothetical protein [Picrophilus oshimae]AAT44095.1 hypothetical membrane spanning protein [Picrophilus oshimae DSM 9789]
MNKKLIYSLIIVLAGTFLISYAGYWYLAFIFSIMAGYLWVSEIKYILIISFLSLIAFLLSFNIGYSLRSLSLFSGISGIPQYIVILITFLIVFSLNTAGMLLGSGINRS